MPHAASHPAPDRPAISSAGDSLINTVNAAINHVLALTPAEIAINVVFTALTVATAAGVAFAFHSLIESRLKDAAADDVLAQARSSRALRWGRTMLRLALILGAVWGVLVIWGFDPLAWWVGAGGRSALKVLGRLTLLSLILLAALEVAGFAIRRTMGNLALSARDPRRAAQIRTLAPLLRGVVQAVIILIGAMMLLSQLGVQIGPLIAGAGVAGIAIGFGAQSLVKDVLTGFFLIIEDIVSIGDSVRIAGCKGDVEAMTLRTIRLRDFDGTLHIFPYGEAQVIHNESKAFSFAVIDLQISYGSDVDAALAAMAEIGEALRGDAVYGPRILAGIEVLGLENLKENGVQLRGRIKTRTGADSAVQREFNRRIKAEFETRHILMAAPHMRLLLPDAPSDGPRKESAG
ncbi:MAG TPA: mechanosensitive ion channel family protein [Caulobacteraceae bacterium]|jgi:small conductance mechanosensitive channel|nr:mechanosensitive ion channel family protein [Caulobacteraceae bacterium]